MKHRLILVLCLLAVLPAPALSQNNGKNNGNNSKPAASTQKPDLLTRAAELGTFKTLLGALDYADLLETLSKNGPYTLLAPTDEAFASLPKDEYRRLIKDKKMLRRFLLHHVLEGEVSGDTIRDSSELESLSEERIEILNQNGEYYLDKVARILTTDIEARNGRIHSIDRVLVPPYVWKSED